MAENRFSLGVHGPDADDQVWLRYDGAEKRGIVRIGRSSAPSSIRAIAIRHDREAVEREFGHLVHAPA